MKPQLPTAILLATVLWTSIASATIILALDMNELVDRSEQIVVATVEHQNALWDDRGRIVTDITLRVEQTIKGATQSTITMRSLGGSLGELGMQIQGEPRLENGQRAIFFLRRSGDVIRPVGMSQGVMTIQQQGQQAVVLPGGAGMALVQPNGPGGQLASAPPALMHSQPLPNVLRRIRAASNR